MKNFFHSSYLKRFGSEMAHVSKLYQYTFPYHCFQSQSDLTAKKEEKISSEKVIEFCMCHRIKK